MKGLMQDYQLNMPAILKRAEALFGKREVVTRLPDRSLHRYAYADFARRAKKLAVALQGLGISEGDRVATLCWNHHQHLEAYFGVPCFGAVLHTLNLRLHPDDLAYIVEHAGDRALILDESLLPLYEKFKDRVSLEHVIVVSESGDVPDGMISYEELLDGADENDYSYPDVDENAAMGMCYTSGTTGRPKGVVYTHRAIYLHSLGHMLADTVGVSESDCILPVVPMFHANAWGLPYSAAFAGSGQVFPGPHLDPESLLELFQDEEVTLTAGVPTIWLGILQVLDKDPDRYDLSALRAMLVGGAAAPRGMIEGFSKRHGLRVLQGWGMTETSPLATIASLRSEIREKDEDEHYDYMAKAGWPLPLVETRARGDEGLVPWDDRAMGEIEVRGPYVASAYYDNPEGADRFTEDGWLKTGDIVTIDELGYVRVQDRTKDLVKSGGEWISTVALENELMAHDAVAEAAVIAIPHEKWQERPLAVVVLKEDRNATRDELLAHLEPRFAAWWLPDRVEFVEEIPKTSVGKFKKSALRERFASEIPADA
jgi:fatty-acyl-CoA synthase